MIAGMPTLAAIRSFSMHDSHRPLSRRLDRCDRFIQKEIEQRQPEWRLWWVCVCVCASMCVRVYMRASVRACACVRACVRDVFAIYDNNILPRLINDNN